MLLIIIWYFFIIIFGLGLEVLASFNITASKYLETERYHCKFRSIRQQYDKQ